MTLKHYINFISFDDGSDIVWSDTGLTDEQISSANGHPYLRYEELDTNVEQVGYNNNMQGDRVITLYFFQNPINGELPPKSEMYSVYRFLLEAPLYVYKETLNEYFIRLDVTSFQRPIEDVQRSKHLFGYVSYNCLIKY